MPFLPNLQNLAYSIFKNLGDEIVNSKKFAELGKCSQCDKEILFLNFEAFTVLPCGHIYHRECIQKKVNDEKLLRVRFERKWKVPGSLTFFFVCG